MYHELVFNICMQVFRHRLEEATGLKVNNFGPVFPVDFTAKSIELELADPPTGWRVFCLAHPAVSFTCQDSVATCTSHWLLSARL